MKTFTSTDLKTFREYVAWRGYTVIRAWGIDNDGFYAYIKGHVSKFCPHFTQVVSGGSVVRLSFKDLNNELITGTFKF